MNAKEMLNAKRSRHEALRSAALANNGGSPSFARFKAAALDEVLELADRSPRMEVTRGDLHGDLDLEYRVAMPVPRLPLGDKLRIGFSVLFHLIYLAEWRDEPPPGWGPLGVFAPLDIWHPNSRPSLRGTLCLGSLAAGMPPKEIVLLGYYLVSLQDLTLDHRDPNGVLNAAACEYYRCHPEYLPLTRAGLFDPWSPNGVDS